MVKYGGIAQRDKSHKIIRALRKNDYGMFPDLDTVFVEALVDIRHACTVHGLDLGQLDHRAHQQYLAELEENL